MTFAEGFYNFFRACPLLESKKLNFDYHDVNPGEYFIATDAPDALIKRYTHGSAIWQKPVYFCMVGSIGSDQRVQIENKVEFEKFREWVEHKNTLKEWPALPDNCHAISLECVTDGLAISEQENTAQYQIQLILTYLRKIRR